MKVLITGATGFLGRALVPALLRRGDEVRAAVRNPRKARLLLGAEVELVSASFDGNAQNCEGVDVIINLAGEPVLPGRWTEARKRSLRESRVGLTDRLVESLSGAAGRPRALISASAVGWYGDRGQEPVHEESAGGSGFLAELCRDWEAAAERASGLGLRVVLLRIGVVLGPDGGALGSMLPPIRAGLGGRLGSGQQQTPWIHVDDAVAAILHAVDSSDLSGPINLTAPHPVTNAELTEALAREVGARLGLPAPAFALRLALGEAAETLLTGQRALPARLLARGFAFRFPRVEQALKDILDESSACLIRAASAEELPDSAYMRERPANRLLIQQTDFPLPVEQVFPFFTQLANLGALTPSAFAFEVDAPEKIELREGAVIEQDVKLGPVEQRWRTVIELWEPGRRFADAQHRGPFASWWHEHSFEPLPDGGCRMTDRVFYATPLGLMGQPVRSAFVEPQLRTIFAWRARALSRRFGGQVLRPA